MGDDIAAIESWATIFTEPKVLAATLSKNWLLHRRTIKGYLADEKSDWGSGKYFKAGVDTAEALTEAVGRIETADEELSMESNDAVDNYFTFAEGFLYKVSDDLDLDLLEACEVSLADETPRVE